MFKQPRSRGHLAVHVIEITLAVLALVAAGTGFMVHQRSRDALKQAAAQAAIQASTAPNPSCNPPLGNGHMGVCAPTQAFAAADLIANAAGAQDNVTGVLGVDVSNNNGCPLTIPPGAKFEFAKLTESTLFTDSCAVSNLAAAKARHIPFGVYDFLRPGSSSPGAEAAHFVAAIRHLGTSNTIELPPVADVETNAGLTPLQVQAYVATWVKDVAAALGRTTGPPAIVYTGEWFWRPQVGGPNDGTDLWVSGYVSRPLLPASWARYTFWQFSDGTYGPTPHFHSGDRGLDSDVFNGTLAQLNELAGITKPKQKPPTRTRTSTTTTRTRTATTSTKPTGHSRARKIVCFGTRATPRSSKCRPVIKQHTWLVARRDHWHTRYIKEHCSRLAKPRLRRNVRGCGTDLRWYALRRKQAVHLHRRYAR